MPFAVVDYAGDRDGDVANLILSIQNGEAGLNLTLADQPDLRDIVGAYADGGFWVALDGDQLVGTLGLMAYGDRGVLKKFFVAEPFRGAGGVSAALYGRLLDRAHQLGLRDIVLDTPAVARRSHGFYAKVGLLPIGPADLPDGYSYPDRDSVLLGLTLIP